MCLIQRLYIEFLLFTSFIPTENLALHQPTWGQYSWPDKSRDFGSENAVDGLYTDRGANGGQCTISVDGVYNATLGVDLGRVVSISHIDIYYRTDNLGEYPLKLNLIYVYIFHKRHTLINHKDNSSSFRIMIFFYM